MTLFIYSGNNEEIKKKYVKNVKRVVSSGAKSCHVLSFLADESRSGALAGAGDSDVDELGDGDDRHSGIENDAKIKF